MYDNFINTKTNTMKKNLIIILVLLGIATLYSYYFGFNDTTTIEDVVIASCVFAVSFLITLKPPKALIPYVHYINAFVIVSLTNTFFTYEIAMTAIFIVAIVVFGIQSFRETKRKFTNNED